MANRQLVDYVRAQMAQRASIDQIRTILLQQGWMSQDVEVAIMEARQQSHGSNKQEHHTNFLVAAISVIIILGLLFGLLVVVFKKSTEPVIIGEDKQVEGAKTLPVEEQKEEPAWYVCRELLDYGTKHACYYDLNFADPKYECDMIPDTEELHACYRGKEQVLLLQYAQANDVVVEVELE